MNFHLNVGGSVFTYRGSILTVVLMGNIKTNVKKGINRKDKF